MILVKSALIVGWILFGICLIALGRRRPDEPDWVAPWYEFLPLMLLFLACSAGTASFFLHQDGIRGEQLFRTLLLRDFAPKPFYLRTGLLLIYLVTAVGVVGWVFRSRARRND